MPDNIVTITFNNDALVDNAGNVVNVNGSVQVDYTTNSFNGNYTITGNGVNGSSSFSNSGGLVSSNGTYTINANGLSLTYSGQQPTSATTMTYTQAGFPQFGIPSDTYSGSNVSVRSVACFLQGTLIQLAGREVAIQDLAVGDMVVTASGAHRPIKWLGHRTLDCQAQPHPADVLPIKVAAGAFGADLPHTDLFLSPGHAVSVTCFENVLIPIDRLVNGATISQVQAERITYWHLELDSHDVVLANGLPSETYLDVGNRHAFDSDRDVVALFPSLTTSNAEGACQPWMAEGAVVDAVREQLLRRAEALGWALKTQAVEPRVSVDGGVATTIVQRVFLRVPVPAGARKVTIGSDTFQPNQIFASHDRRRLGLKLHSLTATDIRGKATPIDLAHSALMQGFWSIEESGGVVHRWTDGSGVIDVSALSDLSLCELTIEMEVEQSGWQAPLEQSCPELALRA